jgi:hypothetical protein
LAPLTAETASGSWLTPTKVERRCKDETEIVTTKNGTARRKYKNGKTSSLGLEAQVRRWPAPTVAMFKGSSLGAMTRSSGASRLNDRLDYAVEQGAIQDGRLNPTWVEWLMGFPLGHTDLQPSETPWSPRSPN